jgi:hypothetical protein
LGVLRTYSQPLKVIMIVYDTLSASPHLTVLSHSVYNSNVLLDFTVNLLVNELLSVFGGHGLGRLQIYPKHSCDFLHHWIYLIKIETLQQSRECFCQIFLDRLLVVN